MYRPVSISVCILLLTSAGQATAQTQSPSNSGTLPSSAGNQPVTTVTVTGARPKVVNRVDRKVYRTDQDLMSTTGSAGDVLNNIPSVEVDPDGNVSLRGDSSVTVLVDGKPTAEMQGTARAGALQSMAASDIQQIEIITSPSAEFKPDGSGGIINIVTKKSRKPGTSGTVQGNWGDGGRYNGNIAASYAGHLVSVRGSLAARNDVRKRIADTSTVSTIGASSRTISHQTQIENNSRKSGSAGIDFTPNAKQTLGVSVDYASRDESRRGTNTSMSTGPNPSAYSRVTWGGGPRTSSGAEFTFDQKTAREGEDFSLNLQTSQSVEKNLYNYTNVYSAPSASTNFEQDFHREAYGVSELSLDYVRPMASDSTLKVGYDGEYDQNRFDDTVAKSNTSPAALAQDHSFDNAFRYRQKINAMYVSYDRKVGKWELLAGLRLEHVNVFTVQRITGDTNTQSYGTAYPTLNAVYALSDDDSLTFGFSKRVRRRDPEDLNPYINASDPNNLRQGNPALKPEMTNSVEAGYRHDGNSGTSYQFTGYYRSSRNGDTEILTVISPDVVLIREANLPRSQSGGVEFGVSGKVFPKLGYSVNGNVFHNEINALALGAGTRSTISGSVKASLDFQASASDRWQLSGASSGKRLTAQGYVLPVSTVNIGYRHQITPKLGLVATVSDIFNSQRGKRVYITPTYTGTYERHPYGRLAYVGLAYTFGGAKKAKDSDFTYEQ